MIRTLRGRLTLWYLGILTVSLGVLAGLLYFSISKSLYRHHDEELAEEARRLGEVLDGLAPAWSGLETALAGARSVPPFVMVRKADGEMMYRSPGLATSEPNIGRHEALVHAVSRGATGPQFFTAYLERSGPVRFICTPIGRGQRMYVQVGRALGDVNATLRTLATSALVLVPVVLVLTSFGGLLIARRALAPIQNIADTARAIGATDLRRRIEVHPRDEELAGLVATLNQLFERLEGAFEAIRQFVADSSHHLQTPLTVMKGSLDLALASPREPQVYERLLSDLAEEVNHMSAVLADLRSLSLAGASSTSMLETPVDLSAAWREASEIVSALGELKNVSVETRVEPNLFAYGDEIRLKQLLLDLGENAVKFTPSGGSVLIEAADEGKNTVLRVSDTGPGISPADLPHIFDRFYRGAASGRESDGTGLGLAIVKRVAEAHGGSIDVRSEPGRGTTFVVRLPRSA